MIAIASSADLASSGEGGRPSSQATASSHLYTSESRKGMTRPISYPRERYWPGLPAAMRRLLRFPARSSSLKPWGRELSRFTRRRSAQKPPVMVAFRAPSGERREAADAVGLTAGAGPRTLSDTLAILD